MSLLIFALVFNAISSSAMTISVGNNGVLLCTSKGYQWVKVEQGIDQSSKMQKHCPLCLAPQNDDTDDSFFSLTTFFVQAQTQANLLYASEANLALKQKHQLAQGRAPPAL